MATTVSLSVLDHIQVASPCAVAWESMAPTASAHVRHCGQCSLNVHNLSGMTREEAEGLIGAHFAPDGTRIGGRLCANWRRRADGTIIFRDCPVGMAKVRERVRRSVARAAALIGLTTLVSGAMARAQRGGWNPREYGSFALVSKWMGMESAAQTLSAAQQGGFSLGGDVAVPAATIRQLQAQLKAEREAGANQEPAGGTAGPR